MYRGMGQPWDTSKSEIRVYDMPQKNAAEFEAYLYKYSNRNPGISFAETRFVDCERVHSAELKLRKCTPEMLAGYLLNYINRVWAYKTLQYNCQTFAADLFS